MKKTTRASGGAVAKNPTGPANASDDENHPPHIETEDMETESKNKPSPPHLKLRKLSPDAIDKIRADLKRTKEEPKEEDDGDSPAATAETRSDLKRPKDEPEKEEEEDDDDDDDFVPIKPPTKRPRKAKNSDEPGSSSQKCKDCFQPLNEVLTTTSDDFPDYGEGYEEGGALVIIAESLGNIDLDEDKMYKMLLEEYIFFDDHGHILPLDCGAIEKNKYVYFSGKIKNYSNWASEGKFVCQVGPLGGWWLKRDDGSDSITVGISSESAHYYLGAPHPKYAAYMESIEKRGELAYSVVDYIMEHPKSSLADMVASLEEDRPDIEELLDQYGKSVVAHIEQIDAEKESGEMELSCLPAIVSLAEQFGVRVKKTVKKKQQPKEKKEKKAKVPKEEKEKEKETPGSALNSMATTTPLVRVAFERLFPGQIHGAAKGAEKVKVSAAEAGVVETQLLSWPPKIRSLEKSVEWTSERKKFVQLKQYFASCTVRDKKGAIELKVGDFVTVRVKNDKPDFVIMKIHEMFDQKGRKIFHGIRFLQGLETILGDALNPMEIFASRDCGDFELRDVDRKVVVRRENAPENWRKQGGRDVEERLTSDYVYKFLVETGECRFEAVKEFNCDVVSSPRKLPVCENCTWRESHEDEVHVIETSDDNAIEEVEYHGVKYEIGDCVLIDPENLRDPWNEKRERAPSPSFLRKKDPVKYPELYRKEFIKPKGYYDDMTAPLRIGRIEGFVGNQNLAKKTLNIKAEIRILDRVDEVEMNDDTEKAKLYPNGLYWSEKISTKAVKKFTGKCKITRESMLKDTSMMEWRAQHGFILLGSAPEEAEKMCREHARQKVPKPEKPLACMDLFAGVGGLSIGMHQAGVTETKWAVEFNHQAAQSFKLNHPDAIVFEGDINAILKRMIDADRDPTIARQWKGLPLPRPGEVDIITGGPPCQGFSGMNRFNYRENAQFRNSLVTTYLSCVEYLRPRYIIMENVKTFVNHGKGVVLKFLLKSLVEAGYQCSAAVLQAGQFGVPQSRTRAIILAAAPGETLPKYPKPLTTFSDRLTGFKIDGISYDAQNTWCSSHAAPFRGITVGEAISDLPELSGKEMKEKMPYKGPPESAFQAEVRLNSNEVMDHMCRQLGKLVMFRIQNIPRYPGSDWRDLPNISITLDGVVLKKLEYPYKDHCGKQRGVCQCAPKMAKCTKSQSQKNRQQKTVIPWCLPHNGYHHNQWQGLYGRVLKDGYFATTLTAPEPMGKQGCVIHYEQHRIVSVRECARSQGFPDTVKFYGRVEDRYRQIGNAVPPPLSRAIGFQIRIAMTGKQDIE